MQRVQKLSDQACKISYGVYDAIIRHPFNQELMYGSLGRDKFSFYVEQDMFFLKKFARCQAALASRIDLQYVHTFLEIADYMLIVEQEMIKQYGLEVTGFITPAALSYTSYLLYLCAAEPVELAVSALAACFWVYKAVGLHIFEHAKTEGNPYMFWIATYSGEKNISTTDKVMDIFDYLAEDASESMRQQMLDAFYKSTCLEWHFWNDAYYKIILDDVRGILSIKPKHF